ncbi:hypothetical protein RND71_021777 [Anisodus tanguticus]|uniref:Transmembrane protein n=1 Tax=Anisodus tanguticus TaxID=243964 RepID=A0AAE1RX53_9SOLA|nr:hypothetical protein RND71_021777 [Anisodus tanguticus]
MEQQQQYRSWKLNVQAKAKNLNFKFVASKFLPNSKYFPFSLKFKYSKFFFRLKSETLTSPNPNKPNSLKSKLHRFLERLRIRRRHPKNNRVVTSPIPNNRVTSSSTNMATTSQSSVVLGNLALFIQSIYQGDKDGIFILGSIVSICFTFLFKNFMARKPWKLLGFVIIAAVFCSNVMHLRFRSHFDQHYLFGFVLRAFKNVASSACSYIPSQLLTAISRVI